MEIPQNDIKASHIQALKSYESGNQDVAWKTACLGLNEDFNDFRCLYQMALVEKDAGRYGLAYNLFRMSSALAPESPDPYNGMGLCHEETFNFEDAERCFRRALKISPNHAVTMSNLGLLYLNQCQPDEALKWVSRALREDPTLIDTRHHRAYANLLKRNWREGWEDWVYILGKVKTRTARQYEGVPEWDGANGKTVIVYGEQGIGDEISFASCIPDVLKNNRVILDCDDRLENLFRRSFPDVQVHGTRFKAVDWLEDADGSVAIGDLPKFYRNAESEFPGTPYLVADPERRIQWNALLKSYGKPAIGIAWTGGIKRTNSEGRSMSLEDFAPIIKSVDATWVVLEYKDRDEEIRAFENKHGIKLHHWKRATHSKDFDDVAGLVSELDLTFSVTTAVVHVAGALGKDCWCLPPKNPRWFYGLEGDLPWYRSVKMFRGQKTEQLRKIADLLKLRFS